VQRRILKWAYCSRMSAGDQLPWSVSYKSRDNASRRVIYSKALRALERKGLVERIRTQSGCATSSGHGRGERTRAVRLTDLGREVATVLFPAN
jgi:hypothetical protein